MLDRTLERSGQCAGVERFARRAATCQIESPYVKKATIAIINCGCRVRSASGYNPAIKLAPKYLIKDNISSENSPKKEAS